MSKKYKGKLCVYCQERPSITQGDHVFSRELFLIPERNNLIKVPAWDVCNNKKSQIEHYLTTILPFGGMHVDAKENLTTLVPSRLEKNQRLMRELNEGIEYLWIKGKDGFPVRKMTIPIDGDRYMAIFDYIIRALSWYHWNSYIRSESAIYSMNLSQFGEEFFEKYFFSLNASNRIDNEIGDKTIVYEGAQASDNDQITIWRFEIYNGLKVSDGQDKGFNESSCVGSISGPPRLVNKVIQSVGINST